MRFPHHRISGFGAAVLVALALAGCKERPQMNPGMPQVSVVTVQPQAASIVSDLPGRVDAVRDAEIRARVTGIVQKIEFEQGSEVKEGQLLFKIDPSQYKATHNQAAAQLKQAQADLYSAKALADRYAPLVKANAISKQEYDNAVASYRQAQAAVAAAQANLDAAAINLGYTDVTSPITGRIGQALVTEGALVEGTSATQMALVQQLDPVYVDFTQSTADLARLRRAFASGQIERIGQDAARVSIVQEDGSVYEHPGKLLFTGITVDPTTGQVNLRAEIPNPDHLLLPGMYVRVRLSEGTNQQALLVPQQALQRTADGLQSLMLVKDDKIEAIAVQTGGVIDGKWLVTSGLKAGDVVVVEGFQKIRPGAPVKASPWNPEGADKTGAATSAPGNAGAGKGETPPAEDKPEGAAAPAASAQKS